MMASAMASTAISRTKAGIASSMRCGIDRLLNSIPGSVSSLFLPEGGSGDFDPEKAKDLFSARYGNSHLAGLRLPPSLSKDYSLFHTESTPQLCSGCWVQRTDLMRRTRCGSKACRTWLTAPIFDRALQES